MRPSFRGPWRRAGLTARPSLPELSLSYNGGKDCLVLLILCLHVLHARSQRQPSLPAQPGQDPQDQHQHTATSPLQCVYIQAPHPFAEVEAFVAESTRAYSLRLATYAKPMKAAFADYLRDRPAVRAVFVGTRRTDPHAAHLSHFDPTDHGWPPFLRIHPVIDWHYADIWTVSAGCRASRGADALARSQGTSHPPAEPRHLDRVLTRLVHPTLAYFVLPALRQGLHVPWRHDRHPPEPCPSDLRAAVGRHERLFERAGHTDFSACVRTRRRRGGTSRSRQVTSQSFRHVLASRPAAAQVLAHCNEHSHS